MTDQDLQADNTIEQEAIQPQQEAQKMLSQEDVNRIVGRAKAEAAERERQKLEAQYQQQLEQARAQQQQQQVAGQQNVDADAIYQQVVERINQERAQQEQEAQQQQFEQQMSQVAQNYLSKVDEAKQLYEDFEDVTKRFDPTRFPQLVYLIAGMEGGGDIVYELAKNPTKLVTLNNLAKEAPEYAQDELAKLAASIKTNREAVQQFGQQPNNAPLDRLQPSRTTGGNGKLSIRDLKAQPWLRG